jgi:hypothetical protein
MNIITYISNILLYGIHKIIGIITTNSTSKIRKITAIKKKCLENGIRGDLIGLNPHSNGEDFSRSKKDFVEIQYNNILNVIKNIINKIE